MFDEALAQFYYLIESRDRGMPHYIGGLPIWRYVCQQ